MDSRWKIRRHASVSDILSLLFNELIQISSFGTNMGLLARSFGSFPGFRLISFASTSVTDPTQSTTH